MGDSLPLGRIAGIRIGINWSWLVVFGLITWSLSEAIFPDQNPGLSQGTYVAMAIAASLLFFASLLLHELGHAFQARRDGMEIEGITLWLFGGVAKFRGMFPSAGAELRIAIAGPAVSLLLGGIFVLAAWKLPLPDVVDGVAAWLGYINLVLLVFNLLPALPLDGGRVLRAILWYLKGEFGWATVVAANIGRGFGYLFVAGGFFLLIFESAFSGVWLAFMGWFLLQAAGSELRYLSARQALGGLRVGDLMVHDPVVVPPDLTLGRFMDEVMRSRPYTTYPVVDNDRAVGLLPLRRVAEVPPGEWASLRVRDYMLPLERVPVLHPDDELTDALQRLSADDVQRALVVDGDDHLLGLLSISDVARAVDAGRRRRRLQRTVGA